MSSFVSVHLLALVQFIIRTNQLMQNCHPYLSGPDNNNPTRWGTIKSMQTTHFNYRCVNLCRFVSYQQGEDCASQIPNLV